VSVGNTGGGVASVLDVIVIPANLNASVAADGPGGKVFSIIAGGNFGGTADPKTITIRAGINQQPIDMEHAYTEATAPEELRGWHAEIRIFRSHSAPGLLLIRIFMNWVRADGQLKRLWHHMLSTAVPVADEGYLYFLGTSIGASQVNQDYCIGWLTGS